MSDLFAGWLPVYAAPAEGDALAALGAVPLGVGKVAAAVALQDLVLKQRPAGVLLFGVCGAYPPRHCADTKLTIGALAMVAHDGFGDEGAATEHGFLDLRALGLGGIGPYAAPATVVAHAAAALRAPVVAGTTVSTCSATEALSAALAARTGAAVESMEGAAAAHVCARHGVPFVQLRAVANWTGDRARAAWDLPRAVAAVQAAVRRLLGW